MAAVAVATAQEYVTAWHADGSTSVMELSQIDSLTFSAPQSDVVLTTGALTDLSGNTATVCCIAKSTTTGADTERGVVYSQISATPTTSNLKSTEGQLQAGLWASTLTGLESGKTCYYRAYAVAGDQTYYGEVRSFQAGETVESAVGTSVDLGLSVEWATSNLNATAAKGASGTSGLGALGLSPNSVYTVVTARGGWHASAARFQSTNDAGATVGATDKNQQFAFVLNPEDTTVFYLYSVGQKKFVKKDRSLSASSPDRIYIFSTGDQGHPYFFSFTADKSASNINIGGAKQMTVDGWKNYDDGNKCVLTAVSNSDYNLAEAQAQLGQSGLVGDPTQAGGYFAWGETSTKDNYAWSTYAYGNGLQRTKYTSSDQKTLLDHADDPATTILGQQWRVPTQSEFEELREKCTWVWTTLQGVNGYRITAPNGNSIFLPAAGFRYGDKLFVNGDFGYYLTKNLGATDDTAISVGFNQGAPAWEYSSARFFGYSIRPVRTAK